jgi:hypothetical protein
MNEVVITSIKGLGKPFKKVRTKLTLLCVGESIQIGGHWDTGAGVTNFTTQHGISENDRIALENIIKGLIEIFGEN